VLSRVVRKKQRGRRFLAAMAVVSLATGSFVFGNAALASSPSTAGDLELDKNATNDLLTPHLGTLKSSVTASASSILVCEFVGGVYPAAGPFTIMVDAEQMTVTSYGATSNKTGGCGFTDPTLVASQTRVYNVTRGVNSSTAAAHSGGADVTQLISGANPPKTNGTDWDQVYASVTADPNDTGDDDKCIALGAVECSWAHDGFGVSVFTGGGSKDDLNINPDPLNPTVTSGPWLWTNSSVPNSDEILDAFAAKYDHTATSGHEFLYFGADRYATNGAKDFGFWFFKNPVAAVTGGTFTGVHAVGDILALGTFTQGGAVATIRVYSWVGTGGNTNTALQSAGAFGDCVPGTSTDNGCNTVNNTTVPSPWAYQGTGAVGVNAPNVIYSGGLLEGGIDLTALNLTGCFSSFMAETRSSPSIGAQLKDFVLSNFESCSSGLTTTPSNNATPPVPLTDSDANGLPDVQIGTGSAGVNVKDAALLQVNGTTTFSGTLSFFICGPIASGTCDTGGVAAGSSTVTANGTYYSSSVKLTSVGRYCWRGVFDSTNNLIDSSDHSTGECFEVKPVTPALSTQAIQPPLSAPVSGPIPFGDPVYDKAILAGTAYEPGTNAANAPYTTINATMTTPAKGKITFTLYGPGDCTTVAAGTGTNPQDVDVSGDGDYFSAGFTTNLPGDFHWVASYDGDSPNTLGTTHNTTCADADEDVTVQQLQPTMDTAQEFVPNDSATIAVASGAGDLDGYVVFKLYVDDTDCSDATPEYESGQIPVSDSTAPLSQTVKSGNTQAYSTTGQTFSWVVAFTSNNDAHLGVTSPCTNEISSITIDNGDTQPAP
jgi:hypothetical protein